MVRSFCFDSRKLFDHIYSLEDRLDVSFSNVQYQDMAPFVGLEPHRQMNDIATFDLYRSRIPTSLFRSIVQDMDVLLSQYGPPVEHETEEATSRFFAPVRRSSQPSYYEETQTVIFRSLIAWLLNLVLPSEICLNLSLMAV